ncbi:MAG TPA: VacB/RNase II family 3'-5' exoribonuclease [Terriglobales bacterium]|jgi:ribonuclease R|nr:VacB/RNase II family 3'-5' exoribonuclease [Terriglobales bacterium]
MAALSDSTVLRKIERQPKSTASYKQLVRELGLHGDERKQLSSLLDSLVRQGALQELQSGRYALPQANTGKNALVGRLSMHRDGFGFVTPDAKPLSPTLKSRVTGDVFIPPPFIGAAMHGDRVLVEVTSVRDDGRAEGRIVRPMTRAHPTVVGIFHYGSRRNYVTPFDQKIAQEITIPLGMEMPDSEPLDTKASGSRKPQHRVLGEEVARRREWRDLEGLVVDVEITDWPTATQNPRGRVIEILGDENDFGVDVEIVIRKFHLPHRFPAEVIEQAQDVSSTIDADELRARRDYRDLPIVTIDGETARDFDDAVLVRTLANGNYELQVHIADVAHYVTEDSPIDEEARLRGTSVYFPDRAVPMLPLELSTDICSLRPHVDRLVLSCTMEIDRRGENLGYEINEGVIRSAERMTYTAVNAIVEGDPAICQRYAPLVENFERMRDLAIILNRKRERRGSIDFDLPEPVIEFDEHGLVKNITRSERNIAHRLIEEFMLSANETVAHYLENKRIASLFRIHEKPDAKRVYDFETIAARFGYSLGVGSLPVHRVQTKADRRASYGTGKRARTIEVPEEVHITPRMYQKLTEKIAGKPEERILSFLMLRSLKQARYSEENLGHFALAASTYTHFTSPIRRYPDLIVHRILKDVLHQSAEKTESAVPVGTASISTQQQPPSPWSKRRDREGHRDALVPVAGPIPLTELHAIAEESSQSERRADEAERALMEWKKVKFMQDRIGEDFDGLIISVTKFGFFVELTDLFIEGLVPLASLSGDHFTFHENTREIIGQRTRKTYRLGERIRVLADRIDPVERKIQFAVFEEAPPLKPKKKKR